MKKLLFLFIIFTTTFTFAQENTEVFVFDIAPSYEGLELLNPRNISNNDGYDNQPSFISNETVIFAGNNDGQTDISEYNLTSDLQKWVNSKTDGGEYSPQKFPSKSDVAAVRLDTNGKQRLYQYDIKTGNSTELIKDLQVAYFAFYNDKKMLATVLNADKLDLVMIDLPTKSVDTMFYKAGRSLQRVPKTSSMSYSLVNEEGNLDLYLLDMNSYESFFVTELPIGIQDYVWINDTQILVGSNNRLYMYDTLGGSEWNRVASLEEYGIKNITRMAISPNGKKLAVVAEVK
ncbi:MAG: TolB family protein [Aequorivita sp.]